MYKFLSLLFIFSFLACAEEPEPKPYGQIRIDLPETHEFKTFEPDSCGYSIDISRISGIVKRKEDCWFNIVYPRYNATIHLTYRSIEGNLPELVNDARYLIMKHSVKADGLREQGFMNPEKRVYGMLVDVLGNAANSLQFYLTDSTDHFLRGALYFNAPPNRDSLDPVIDFIRDDMQYMMESVTWKD